MTDKVLTEERPGTSKGNEEISQERNEKDKFDLQNALSAISTIVLDQSRTRRVEIAGRSTNKTAIEIATKKSAHILAKNLDRISKIDLDAVVEETLKAESKKREEDAMMGSTTDFPYKKSLHGEDLIRYKRRGSIMRPRSSILPLPMALLGLENISIDSRQKVGEKEISVSKASTMGSKYAKSENLGVWSMQLDVPAAPALSRYEAAAIACVLKDCLDQLTVLRYAIPAEINDRWEKVVKPIEEKYGLPDEPRTVFRDEANLPPLTLTPMEKLQRDRTYMHDILKKTLNEVECRRRFDILEKEVNQIAKMLEDEHNLEENCYIWQSQVNQLRALIKHEKEKIELEKREMLELAQKTNGKVDDTLYEIALKLGYTEKWENARLTQQRLRFEGQEQDITDEVNECDKEKGIEEIFNAELCGYFRENIKDMEDEMLAWSSRYDEEIERKQREIDDMKARVEEQKLEIQDLCTLRDERQAFIDACLAEGRRFEEEEEEYLMSGLDDMW